ncbi:PREDICTED: uncharacterized protein LOC108371665 [Rhagoletis zephyria]|uniref:uncharacterized protein LOC108371665 n=1 Tax=Rhagoletis zephyria TaxID=28612 RepID=UPI0008112FB0|nr:PREDICTED: uncharacterized protein LOC108371665 [Rhagoletis zephyria]
MKDFISILEILLISLASASAQCAGTCRVNVPSQSVCIVQMDPQQCLKIKECTLNELNCFRWRQKIPLLSRSPLERCSHISGPIGSGRCTTAQEQCLRVNCANDKVVRCQRAGKTCRLLTNCEAKRENCRRPPSSHLKAISRQPCQGLKRSDGFKPCKVKKRRRKLG